MPNPKPVARLSLPLLLGGLEPLALGLSAVYGPGLRMESSEDGEWLEIFHPGRKASTSGVNRTPTNGQILDGIEAALLKQSHAATRDVLCWIDTGVITVTQVEQGFLLSPAQNDRPGAVSLPWPPPED